MRSSQNSRRRSSASLHSPRSSPDSYDEMSRHDYRNEYKSSTKIELNRLKQWLSDVTGVLDRPTIALTVFAIGVFFIILASKQVKKFFDALEFIGITVQLPYGFLYNFMAALVFMFVWVDMVLFTKCAKWLIQWSSSAWSYALKIRASMKEVENKERYNLDRNRKKRT
ncbi:unnamed protein product [Candidula unifasciata]|uniref:Uncharacterized protein n=1 Tax=Candidula unifasciata TaxID=100452 RepID=A0A8S3Z155_9EUPU|nr:unnamed protein product [Candidula unifasciata]